MSMLKAGRPSSEKRTMTMEDVAGVEKMKRVNFDLPETLHTRLKIYAASRGLSVKDILTQFVEGLV